ncbi:helix-turn-helix domain-containing protein [Pyramidobacter sp. C12-8]|uniref:helix-turn-helix domain-containing protein n=1 Tax=Pyramidobacter sp. C12-8 TaxID=1943580 RepID=UPI00098ED1D6|nr:helix-turn-helix transcriptional regulator [Pyramidobacter sp. C12-8]OON89276.1 hypothetical protein B0D78_04680 [Pyramidobacter sp. C12-8]
MYEIADLFDMRSAVGAKLESMLLERGFTKAGFCKAAGISRPTLDKLLSAGITNKTNYEKHITKVLDGLKISADMLMGNSPNRFNQTRLLKQLLRVDEKQLAERTGVSTARLKEIEAGAKAEISELRDLAYALRTGVRSLLGTNYFPPQIARWKASLDRCSAGEELAENGFWGHIGILPSSSEKYLWYPITGTTRSMVYGWIGHGYLVIPCMNNKVLLINTSNVNRIVLLDDGCGAPSSCTWDSSVDEGEVPPVIYESLSDYTYYEETEEQIPEKLISPNLCKVMASYVEKDDGTSDALLSEGAVVCCYADGKTERYNIDFGQEQSLSLEISLIYEFGDEASDERFLFFHDEDGAENFLNKEKISIIELPLFNIEEAICKEQEEALAE